MYLLLTLAFFAICVGLIKGCDLVIGPDELDELDEPGDVTVESRPGVTR